MASQHGNSRTPDTPTPDPALQRLRVLAGEWKITGRPLGADKDRIFGRTRFKWLDGDAVTSFFLQQDMELDYDGLKIRSHELIGYDSRTRRFNSLVFSNMAPDPWPYVWDVVDGNITISIRKDPMSATFTGKFADDRKSFSGGWRPNPGADEKINAPYDLIASKV